jgi:predicted RNA-binding protein YlqC (UPF0109 family)
MKDTLAYLVSQIVDHPEAVLIDESQDGETLVLTIHVHAEDMGKVIGKSGRIIRAIRDLIKIIATKQNKFVDVTLYEENPSPEASEAEAPATDTP